MSERFEDGAVGVGRWFAVAVLLAVVVGVGAAYALFSLLAG